MQNCRILSARYVQQVYHVYRPQTLKPIRHVNRACLVHTAPFPSIQQNVPAPISTPPVSQLKSPQKQFAFDNHKLAYGHRSLGYLLRAYIVLQICRMQRVTTNASKFARFGSRLLGQRVFGALIKASFFGHFTGAEDTQQVRRCVKTMYTVHNIRPILHYHAERELGECKNAEQRADAVASNVALTMESMRIVKETAPDAFAALKITALIDPQVLAKISSTIMTIRRICEIPSTNTTLDPSNLTFQNAQRILEAINIPTNSVAHLAVFRLMQNLTEQRQMLQDLSIINVLTKSLPFTSNIFYQHTRPGTFTTGEFDEFCASWQQFLHVLDTARQLNVRLFIDAEQTWLQPAIGQLALLAMQRYNKTNAASDVRPLVWGTLQCYLCDAEQTYRECTDIADREQFSFVHKFVRGAYIRSELERAKTMGYNCATCPAYYATNDNYDKLASLALERIVERDHKNAGLQVTFATHNEKSIGHVMKKMRELNISDDSVAFGQLYGMCDRITYDLAKNGYTVLKVVPYGPIPLLTPYFVRRAEENSLMLGRCEKDLQMLKRELMHRLQFKTAVHKREIF